MNLECVVLVVELQDHTVCWDEIEAFKKVLWVFEKVINSYVVGGAVGLEAKIADVYFAF